MLNSQCEEGARDGIDIKYLGIIWVGVGLDLHWIAFEQDFLTYLFEVFESVTV